MRPRLLALAAVFSLALGFALATPAPVRADCATLCYTLAFQIESPDGHNTVGSGAVTRKDGHIHCSIVDGTVTAHPRLVVAHDIGHALDAIWAAGPWTGALVDASWQPRA